MTTDTAIFAYIIFVRKGNPSIYPYTHLNYTPLDCVIVWNTGINQSSRESFLDILIVNLNWRKVRIISCRKRQILLGRVSMWWHSTRHARLNRCLKMKPVFYTRKTFLNSNVILVAKSARVMLDLKLVRAHRMSQISILTCISSPSPLLL